MGMSASQARLLSITSRMNDVEYKSQQISNTKVRLADEAEQVANAYTKALNKTKLTFSTYDKDHGSIKVDLNSNNLANLIKEKLRNTDYLVLESNHDLEMLNTGFYPEVLKQRIKSNRGHLSNVDAGWLLNELVADKPMRVLLAHLSQENNLPSLALNTVAEILKKQDNR